MVLVAVASTRASTPCSRGGSAECRSRSCMRRASGGSAHFGMEHVLAFRMLSGTPGFGWITFDPNYDLETVNRTDGTDITSRPSLQWCSGQGLDRVPGTNVRCRERRDPDRHSRGEHPRGGPGR